MSDGAKTGLPPETPPETLGEVGELTMIERITRRLSLAGDVIVGPGEDGAVVRPAASHHQDWVLTSDAVIEGVHFAAGTGPAAIGHKAMARVLSDLAAMGADPAWALVNVVAPAATDTALLDGLAAGAAATAERHGLSIIGGDLAAGPALQLHAFALGSVPRGKALLRSGARPGDAVFVTGALGNSLSGRHLTFEPRIKQGLWLRGWASALIDLSDGLASDLRHVLGASRVGARIWTELIPKAPDASGTDPTRTALEHALLDGEDYELLFTVPAGREEAFADAWHESFELTCTLIGEITDLDGRLEFVDDSGSILPIRQTGYEHFRSERPPRERTS